MRFYVNGEIEIHEHVLREPNPTFTTEFGERGSASFRTRYRRGHGLYGPGSGLIGVYEDDSIDIDEDGTILTHAEHDANRLLRRGDIVSAESNSPTYRTLCNNHESLYRYITFDRQVGSIRPQAFRRGAVPYGFAGRVKTINQQKSHTIEGLNLLNEFSIGGWIRAESIQNCDILSYRGAGINGRILMNIQRQAANTEAVMTYEDGPVQVLESGHISVDSSATLYRMFLAFPGSSTNLQIDNIDLSDWTHLLYSSGKGFAGIYINGVLGQVVAKNEVLANGVDLDFGTARLLNQSVYDSYLMDEWAIFRNTFAQAQADEFVNSRRNDRVFYGQVWDVSNVPAKAKSDLVYTDVTMVGASSALENTTPIFDYVRQNIPLIDLVREIVPDEVGGIEIDIGWVDPTIEVHNVSELKPVFPWELLNNIADLLNVNVWLDNYGFIHFLDVDNFTIDSDTHKVGANAKDSKIGDRSSLYASTVYVHRTSSNLVEIIRVDSKDGRKDRFGETIKIIESSGVRDDLRSVGMRYLNLHHTTVGDYIATLQEGSIGVMHVGDVLDIDDAKHGLKEKRILGKLTTVLKPVRPFNVDVFEHSVVASSGHWGNKKRSWWQSISRER